ncbi:hypothetical protein [Thermococcus sp.]|uniref:hypothetical protein n=1 Tax=Thermococcus sp. TaxID=35749 RepID=UPI0026278F69|nr:hypothetical protein [Thermococcus sp.]
MRIIVRSKRDRRKVVLKMPDESFRRLETLLSEYGFRLDALLLDLARTESIDVPAVSDGELKSLSEEVSRLEEEVYKLEGKWSPLRFKTYYIVQDNRNLSIQLSGMIAENKRLRKTLGLEEKDWSEAEELIRYYLSI